MTLKKRIKLLSLTILFPSLSAAKHRFCREYQEKGLSQRSPGQEDFEEIEEIP
jgi:hypothetical protein